ncbi:DUF2125 domain-containing protein [Roseisalinus antarcticus]|uniref:DUF2125 domain-containing protein n=1 Tax=Roseisalinus antarcticus TaxID=254357 RepID=A0A1Y5SPV8_9RHOB|nr:DUF2125 domain-containing protein [Roseisalinus antarcticus]SLN42644.1 hypothetical protein ROA7023_01713 [Roseisalinus antarcticus]
MRHILPAAALSAVSAVLAGQAPAQITPEDAWTLYAEQVRATGLEIRATESRVGQTLVLSNILFAVPLPDAIGSLEILAGPVQLTGQEDGSVSIHYPENTRIRIVGRSAENPQLQLDAAITVAMADHTSVATGTPVEILLRSSSSSLQFRLAELRLRGDPEIEGLSSEQIRLSYSISSPESARFYRRDDGLVHLEAQSTAGEIAYEFVIDLPEAGVRSQNYGTTAATETSFALSLPRGGIDYADLSSSLRAGMTLEAATRTSGTTTMAISSIGDQASSLQDSRSASGNATLRLGSGGFAVLAETTGIALSYSMPDLLPFAVNGTVGGLQFSASFPVLASGDTQRASYAVALSDLAVEDRLFRLLDPTGLVPQDPLSFEVDVESRVRLLADVLDFATIGQMIRMFINPVEVSEVTLNQGNLSGFGAAVESSGHFTLDFEDLESFDGMPRPEGTATARLSGVNQLLDRLVTVGLLGDGQAGAARMGLGMMTRVVGDDMLESNVEITPEAQVFVNGARMR